MQMILIVPNSEIAFWPRKALCSDHKHNLSSGAPRPPLQVTPFLAQISQHWGGGERKGEEWGGDKGSIG